MVWIPGSGNRAAGSTAPGAVNRSAAPIPGQDVREQPVYEVGRGEPPGHSRFKKGPVLVEALTEPVAVTVSAARSAAAVVTHPVNRSTGADLRAASTCRGTPRGTNRNRQVFRGLAGYSGARLRKLSAVDHRFHGYRAGTSSGRGAGVSRRQFGLLFPEDPLAERRSGSGRGSAVRLD
jgi:hypothetical protein